MRLKRFQRFGYTRDPTTDSRNSGNPVPQSKTQKAACVFMVAESERGGEGLRVADLGGNSI